MTQGAVSHQVKGLEAEIGLKLFDRERQRLVITDAGRDCLSVVRDAFDGIASGTERLLQRQKSGVLTVSTSADPRAGNDGPPRRSAPIVVLAHERVGERASKIEMLGGLDRRFAHQARCKCHLPPPVVAG